MEQEQNELFLLEYDERSGRWSYNFIKDGRFEYRPFGGDYRPVTVFHIAVTMDCDFFDILRLASEQKWDYEKACVAIYDFALNHTERWMNL